MAYIPEGRNHPVDYSKTVLIGGSCEVEDQGGEYSRPIQLTVKLLKMSKTNKQQAIKSLQANKTGDHPCEQSAVPLLCVKASSGQGEALLEGTLRAPEAADSCSLLP